MGMICAVPSPHGWCMASCRRTVVGWKMEQPRWIPGTGLDQLLTVLRGDTRSYETLILGIERQYLLVRIGNSDVEPSFPDGTELSYWSRNIVTEHGPRIETVGMLKEARRTIVEKVRESGFAHISLFPVWYGAIAELNRSTVASAFVHGGGGTMRTSGGWTPWRTGETLESGVGQELEYAVRGGLVLHLSRAIPADWTTVAPALRTWRPWITAGVLVFACVVSLLLWVQDIERSIGIEETRLKELQALAEDSPEGYSVDEVIALFHRIGNSQPPGVKLNQIRLNERGSLTITGIAFTASDARAFFENMGMAYEGFSVAKSDSGVQFRGESVVR